ncbi:unnamed protein product [Ilex paraguariensis]|uniref:Uncharacterized protein n=1 Tax=Ilex paraguariensis TaxID=185542 RepID=A0ABC8SIG8_9AQUA
MEMMYYQLARSSYQDSLKVLEADIQHANALYLNLFHILVYKVDTDGRPKISTHGRKATIKDFYGA